MEGYFYVILLSIIHEKVNQQPWNSKQIDLVEIHPIERKYEIQYIQYGMVGWWCLFITF